MKSFLLVLAFLAVVHAIASVAKPAPVWCLPSGSRCNGGGCCPGSECVPVPGSRIGVCRALKCLASGESCVLDGTPCCATLSCTVVNQGAAPDGPLPRVCFASNCGTGICPETPCCPGNACGMQFGKPFCLAPPAAPPGIGGLPL